MANIPKPAAGKYPKLELPVDAVRMKCVNCNGDKATRATYQHVHEDRAVITFDMAAYRPKTAKVPYNWPCQCGEKHVWAIYVECGACGYIAYVDNEKKLVRPPTKKEA